MGVLDQGQHKEESIVLLLWRSLEQVNSAAGQMFSAVGLLALAPSTVEPVAQAMGLRMQAAKRLLGVNPFTVLTKTIHSLGE